MNFGYTEFRYVEALEAGESEKYYASGLRPTCSTEGMELVKAYEFSKSGEYVVDTSELSYGVYEFEYITSPDAEMQVTEEYQYRHYNWMTVHVWLAGLFGQDEEIRDRYTP